MTSSSCSRVNSIWRLGWDLRQMECYISHIVRRNIGQRTSRRPPTRFPRLRHRHRRRRPTPLRRRHLCIPLRPRLRRAPASVAPTIFTSPSRASQTLKLPGGKLVYKSSVVATFDKKESGKKLPTDRLPSTRCRWQRSAPHAFTKHSAPPTLLSRTLTVTFTSVAGRSCGMPILLENRPKTVKKTSAAVRALPAPDPLCAESTHLWTSARPRPGPPFQSGDPPPRPRGTGCFLRLFSNVLAFIAFAGVRYRLDQLVVQVDR